MANVGLINVHDFIGQANRYGERMTEDRTVTAAPVRLRHLVSWQAGKVAAVATRLTLQRMTAGERGDFAVLATLREFGDLSQAEIGRHLTLDRNDVNEIATRLERSGYVHRRVDPDDRRRKVLTATPDGVEHLDGLEEHADAVQGALLAALTAKEQGELIRLLGLVLAAHGPQPA